MTARSGSLQLDLNNPVFQEQLFALSKDEQRAVLNTLAKLSKMTWQQVYSDTGLKWEVIVSRVGPHGGRLYSFRIGSGFRAIAYRQDDWLRVVSTGRASAPAGDVLELGPPPRQKRRRSLQRALARERDERL